MRRDHTKLRVFHDAHALTLAIDRETKHFPKDEWFGLRLQMRRAAASTPTNIVEGNARRTTRDYCNFLNIALASACELAYLVSLATELGLVAAEPGAGLRTESSSVVKQMQTLVNEMEARLASEEREQPRRGPKTVDRGP